MKKLGRWLLLLLVLELLLAFWVGLRVRDRYESPLRIIGATSPEQPATLFARTGQRRPTHSTST